MNTRRLSSVIAFFVIVAALAAGGVGSARAQQPQPLDPNAGPVQMINQFSYQGQLKNGNAPVNGTCDFLFSVWDRNTDAIGLIGVGDLHLAVPVANGLFNVMLNDGGEFNPATGPAFDGGARWLQIQVRCPATTGSWVTLSPRQLIGAAPYAAGLVPGSRITGAAYQVLKVTNTTTVTGIPAAVTGEIPNSLDGVGVYGGYTSTATGSTGMGVWGRTYARGGAGIRATAYNGSTGLIVETLSSGGTGIKATSAGVGLAHPTMAIENINDDLTPTAGIAIYALNHDLDSTIVARNSGNGDVIRGLSSDGNFIVYRVTHTGHVFSTAVEVNGGSDLAEQFAVSAGAAPEPGTLMVIDADHPGQLKPSDTAYDTKVAGVVSGAGGLEPGLTLAQQSGSPIAIAGRVYVKAEANSGPIQPGDLLTSSSLAGYAMKAADRSLSVGAIIGKAMTGLDSGTGLVLVLVNLQ